MFFWFSKAHHAVEASFILELELDISGLTLTGHPSIYVYILGWIISLWNLFLYFCPNSYRTPTYLCIWVCPPEVARFIRRSRPNLMKLSGFVELVSLIILVTTFLKFDRFFTEIQVKNCRSISGIFAIFAKKRPFRLQRNRWNYIINRSNHKTNDIFWILASSCIRIPKN